MGRPLNKKYFGNRNIGANGNEVGGSLSNSQNYADDRIGGEGVGSVTINTEGTYTSALPTVSFSDPTLPGGVTATGTVHGHALTAVATVAGAGYDYGDVLAQNVTAGNDGIYATWTVSAIKTGTMSILDNGSACDPGDEITYSGTYGGGTWTTPLRVRVTTTDGSGNVTGFSVVTPGVWSGAVRPTTTAGATFTQVADGTDHNAAGLSFTFNDDWGVAAVTVVEQGDYTAVTGGAKATTATPAGGTGATLTITYGVSGVVIDQKGSGYTNVADAAPTFSTGAAAGTSVLTTDTGETHGMNVAGNQENAIVAYGYIDGGREIVDIIRQTNGRSYKIQGADGIVRSAKLVTDGDCNADGEMDITATDFGGGTYRVAKLSGRKATLVRKGSGSWEFATGACVPWTFAAAPAATALQTGYNVKIDNA